MGMTIVEKILARASGARKVEPGQLVIVEVETTVFIDTNFYASHRREMLRVHDPDKIVVVLDHLVPAQRRELLVSPKPAAAASGNYDGPDFALGAH